VAIPKRLLKDFLSRTKEAHCYIAS